MACTPSWPGVQANGLARVQDLDARGVAFKSLTENIDTSTPGGPLVSHLFAALAAFERDLIRERTLAGLRAASARGRKGGRPTVWSDDKLAQADSLYRSGSTAWQ